MDFLYRVVPAVEQKDEYGILHILKVGLQPFLYGSGIVGIHTEVQPREGVQNVVAQWIAFPGNAYRASVEVCHLVVLLVKNHNSAVREYEHLVVVFAPHAMDMLFLGIVKYKVDYGQIPVWNLLFCIDIKSYNVGKIDYTACLLGRKSDN